MDQFAIDWIMQATTWNEDRAKHAIAWLDEHDPNWQGADFIDTASFYEHQRAIAEAYFAVPTEQD